MPEDAADSQTLSNIGVVPHFSLPLLHTEQAKTREENELSDVFTSVF